MMERVNRILAARLQADAGADQPSMNRLIRTDHDGQREIAFLMSVRP